MSLQPDASSTASGGALMPLSLRSIADHSAVMCFSSNERGVAQLNKGLSGALRRSQTCARCLAAAQAFSQNQKGNNCVTPMKEFVPNELRFGPGTRDTATKKAGATHEEKPNAEFALLFFGRVTRLS